MRCALILILTLLACGPLPPDDGATAASSTTPSPATSMDGETSTSAGPEISTSIDPEPVTTGEANTTTSDASAGTVDMGVPCTPWFCDLGCPPNAVCVTRGALEVCVDSATSEQLCAPECEPVPCSFDHSSCPPGSMCVTDANGEWTCVADSDGESPCKPCPCELDRDCDSGAVCSGAGQCIDARGNVAC